MEPILLKLDIEWRDGLIPSYDGRPDRRLEVLVRYCFDGNEFRRDKSLSTDNLLGLALGDKLSGSSIITAAHVVSQFSCFEHRPNRDLCNELQKAETNR